ncbi:hypothetical protein VNO77_48814 [Canavalia gladiata]|uniref:Uncharacterized protein n=1 Tax=Canavalia gladiata TaxID=3824 RepID=A0AAN9JGZ0_CANGL
MCPPNFVAIGSQNIFSKFFGGVPIWGQTGQKWQPPLCHLQYPVAYLSRLQRILPAARWELRFKASRRANSPDKGRQRHVPLGGRGPLLLVGKRTAGARVASSPDSDLEAFSHNPTHGSFAPLAFQPSAMTNCANQRFLSY